jgi:hypothetical protein
MNLDKYNQIRDSVRTGDVFAFSGKGNTSNLIKHFTFSKYSHVGMALWITPMHSLVNRLFIIESTTLNNVPDLDGEFRRGVQMVPLAQRLEGYDGQCWWVPIKVPILDDDEKAKLTSWLFQKYSSHIDYDTAQAIAAGIDPEKWIPGTRWIGKLFGRWTNAHEDLRKMFCSELVTKALQEINRVPADINPSEQTPADVLQFPCLDTPVQICD